MDLEWDTETQETRYMRDGDWVCRVRRFELPFAASVPLPARVGSLLRATGLVWPSRCCLMLCCRTFAALQYILPLTADCVLYTHCSYWHWP